MNCFITSCRTPHPCGPAAPAAEAATKGGTMSNISARLDRLPITSLHRIALAALAFGFFFELGDLNSFAFAAPAIIRVWHIPVRDVALITSASFGGMFLGGVGGGRFADPAQEHAAEACRGDQ